jgi:hypothetical protein
MTFITKHMCVIGAFVMLQLFCLPTFAQTLEPYQGTRSILDSSTCPNAQCTFVFQSVPAGKRLVIDSVSARLGSTANLVVLEGNGVAFFVTKSHPDLTYLTARVTVSFDAGNIPKARIPGLNTSQHTSLAVTLVGHLVPR